MSELTDRLRRYADLGSALPLGVAAAVSEAADEIDRLDGTARVRHTHVVDHHGKVTGIPVCACGAMWWDEHQAWVTLP